MSKRSSHLILGAILVAAAAVRLAGIGNLHFPDESWQLYRSLKIGAGEFVPNWFVGVYSYLMFLWYSGFFVVGLAAGLWSSANEFMGVYYTAPYVFYVAGRTAESLAGVGGVYCLYLLGKSWFSRSVGRAASLFLALNITHIQVSQIARGQSIALLLGLLALIFLERYFRRGLRGNVFFSGVFLAGAFSIRIYYLAYFLPPLIAAIILARRRCWKRLIPGILVFLAAFSVFTCIFIPEFILNPADLLSGLNSSAVPLISSSRPSDARPWEGITNPLAAYLGQFMPASFGWPLYLAGGAGIVCLLLRINGFQPAVVVLLPVITILIMGQSRLVAARYILPVFPMIFLAAAVFVERVVSLWVAPERKAIPVFLLSFLLAAPGIPAIVRWDVEQNRLKTVDMAREWIIASIPDRAGIAVESTGFSGPNIRLYSVIDYDIYRMTPEELRSLYAGRMKTDPAGSRALEYFIEHPPKPWHRIYDLNVKEPVSAEYLLGEGVEYFVLSSGVTVHDFLKSKYPDLVITRPAFYAWVEANCDLIRTFAPSEENPGPEIRVYKLSDRRSSRSDL